MKSSSITGLSYALIPADTIDQKTYAAAKTKILDAVTTSNAIYFFEGTMPDPTILQAYSDINKLQTDYATKLVGKLEDFDIKYTYDAATRTRKLQKVPVDALKIMAGVTGTIGWVALDLQSVAISVSFNSIIFTDAIGGWDDAEQSVLVSSTAVTAGQNFTLKDISVTLRDAMLADLV